jgi:hypothetical protein
MDAPIEHRSRRRRRIGTVRYAVIVGAVAGILLAQTVQPVGLGLGLDTGAPIYLGIIVALATMAVDTILRALLDRWPVTPAIIPVIASAAGVVAGWWALHNTMGGPA